jgi:predicted lactoylglutathione lyase
MNQMPQMIFLNLPVKDLATATAFYEGLGFVKNPNFSDENASSMALSEEIVFMLLQEEFFKTFITKDLGNPAATTSAAIGLSRDSREAVDEISDKALASGGTAAKDPQDYGFMYGRSFHDPDGHLIEVIWMDPAQLPE